MMNKRLVVVAGPTAVGKTKMAIDIANHFHTEIISCDARQFYREMLIGTAKPDAQELQQARHHFIDTHSIHDEYDAGKFALDVDRLLPSLFKSHDVVVMTGGSGLYIQAVCDGLDEMPEAAHDQREALQALYLKTGLTPLLDELSKSDPTYFEQVDRNNPQRIIRALEVIRSTGKPFSSYRKGQNKKQHEFEVIKIALKMDMTVLYERIDRRMDLMIAKGLFEEAIRLLPYQHLNALQTVGYREIFSYLGGEYDEKQAVRLLKRNSRRYAKRQMTWLRRDKEFEWFNHDQYDAIIQHIDRRGVT